MVLIEHSLVNSKHSHCSQKISKNFNISSYPTLEIVYLAPLFWLKMLILISINILDMELELTDMDVFDTIVVELVEI